MPSRSTFLVGLSLSSFGLPTLALDNGAGLRPTLGWNSWNVYKEALDENVVRETAKMLISTGLAAKGFVYVNLDDCWHEYNRSASSGDLIPDAAKFPTPMKKLVDDIHSLGLKFGIYTDVGYKTCQKRPGTYGHETQDAELFANWEVDFVKSDSCFTSADPTSQPANGTLCYEDYQKFAAALNATGRSMVHSVKGPCGEHRAGIISDPCTPVDAYNVANLRRAANDVRNEWDSCMSVLEQAVAVTQYSRPGFFLDMDILEIGNGVLTPFEERSVFSLWCALKSPLLLGNNMTNITQATLDIVGNVEMLAVNQDLLGMPAKLIINQTDGVQVYAGPLGEARQAARKGSEAVDEHVVVIFNSGDKEAEINVLWSQVGACDEGKSCTWDVLDLWTGDVLSQVANVSVNVGYHSSVAVRLENRTVVQE
jgi:alpha-galactosidase